MCHTELLVRPVRIRAQRLKAYSGPPTPLPTYSRDVALRLRLWETHRTKTRVSNTWVAGTMG